MPAARTMIALGSKKDGNGGIVALEGSGEGAFSLVLLFISVLHVSMLLLFATVTPPVHLLVIVRT
jgi:hypothetical protein